MAATASRRTMNESVMTIQDMTDMTPQPGTHRISVRARHRPGACNIITQGGECRPRQDGALPVSLSPRTKANSMGRQHGARSRPQDGTDIGLDPEIEF